MALVGAILSRSLRVLQDAGSGSFGLTINLAPRTLAPTPAPIVEETGSSMLTSHVSIILLCLGILTGLCCGGIIGLCFFACRKRKKKPDQAIEMQKQGGYKYTDHAPPMDSTITTYSSVTTEPEFITSIEMQKQGGYKYTDHAPPMMMDSTITTSSGMTEPEFITSPADYFTTTGMSTTYSSGMTEPVFVTSPGDYFTTGHHNPYI
jgi:hypothetical protein